VGEDTDVLPAELVLPVDDFLGGRDALEDLDVLRIEFPLSVEVFLEGMEALLREDTDVTLLLLRIEPVLSLEGFLGGSDTLLGEVAEVTLLLLLLVLLSCRGDSSELLLPPVLDRLDECFLIFLEEEEEEDAEVDFRGREEYLSSRSFERSSIAPTRDGRDSCFDESSKAGL